MKRLVLVLLVLGLSVPAIADVFVYNSSFKSGVEFKYDGDKDAWGQLKVSGSAYVVVRVDSNSPNDVDIWSIDTWEEKDTDEDDKPITIKYYTVDGPLTLSFLQTLIANKNTWIIEGTPGDQHNSRNLFSGQAKLTKIGSQTYTVAATLSGYVIFGDIESENVGGGPMSLKLNSKFTLYVQQQMAVGEDVESAISDYFENVLGYEPG